MKPQQGCSRLWIGAMAVLSLGVLWYILFLTFSKKKDGEPVGAVKSTNTNADRDYVGQYLSAAGKTKYELDPKQMHFSFFTMIDGLFSLQTDILPYKVISVADMAKAIEISGPDNRAGGGPSTVVRLTKISENEFRLERIKPIGGDLGVFRK